MIAYNYLVAKDASSISAEISQWCVWSQSLYWTMPMKQDLPPSLYGNKHGIIAALSQRFGYGRTKQFATTVSLFGSWTSGDRFAYVYGGDINNDGTATNDLLYVPTDAEIDAMTFAPLIDVNGISQNGAAQRAALKNISRLIVIWMGWEESIRRNMGAKHPGTARSIFACSRILCLRRVIRQRQLNSALTLSILARSHK